MIEILKAILFGIVEGITEWLPISSTGHMILLDEFIQLDVSPEFYSMFQVVIQLGAIMAVVILFWNDFFPFGKKDNPYPLAKEGILSYVKVDKVVLWIKILVACIPAAVVGVLFDEQLEAIFYFGMGFSTFLQSTLFTIRRKRFPRSMREVAIAGPVLEVNTRRAGSSLSPMLKGCTLIPMGPSAIDGHTSSICACRIPSLPGTRLYV